MDSMVEFTINRKHIFLNQCKIQKSGRVKKKERTVA